MRGPLNNGGLFGERSGWHLPGFADGGWATRPVPDTTAAPGTFWYRTGFDLAIPAGHDASLGLTLGNPAVLDPRGHNTLALAVTSDGGAANTLERVALTNLGMVRGG
jgi:hypothetical protein